MNTTTLAIAAAGAYFLLKGKSGTQTEQPPSPPTGTGSTGTGTGIPFATVAGAIPAGTFASYQAVGYPHITGKYDGVIQLDPDQVASINILCTSFGVRSPRISVGQWGAKAIEKIQGKPGSLTIKIFDASAGANNTTSKKFSSGIRGFSEITVEHRKDSGMGAAVEGAVKGVAAAGAKAAGSYVEDKINSLIPG